MTADWTGAACASMDTRIWFRRTTLLMAQEICAECPIAGFCLTWSVDNRVEFGVWGGMRAEDRIALMPDRRLGFDAYAFGYWKKRAA